MNDARAIAARAYLEARVKHASPAELIALLYEGLVKELRYAMASIDRGEIVERCVAIGRAVGILSELRTSINHTTGGGVATNLERLYAYWTGRITEAHARSDRGPIELLLPQIESLRASWTDGVIRGGGASPAATAPSTAADKERSEGSAATSHSETAGGAKPARPSGLAAGALGSYAAAMAAGRSGGR